MHLLTRVQSPLMRKAGKIISPEGVGGNYELHSCIPLKGELTRSRKMTMVTRRRQNNESASGSARYPPWRRIEIEDTHWPHGIKVANGRLGLGSGKPAVHLHRLDATRRSIGPGLARHPAVNINTCQPTLLISNRPALFPVILSGMFQEEIH